MDGLALYRLNRLPTKKLEKKRKLSPLSTPRDPQQGINNEEYFCCRCHTLNHLTETSIVQCTSCDYRILEKKRQDRVVIKAV